MKLRFAKDGAKVRGFLERRRRAEPQHTKLTNIFTQTTKMASNGNVSHSQIWDDSSLVDSWNEALDEYKVRTLESNEGQN